MRIPKQINKITRLTVLSKRNYWSLDFSKRNHSPNKTVAGASRGYPTRGGSGEKKGFRELRVSCGNTGSKAFISSLTFSPSKAFIQSHRETETKIRGRSESPGRSRRTIAAIGADEPSRDSRNRALQPVNRPKRNQRRRSQNRRRGLRFSPARRFPSPPTVSGLRHLHLAVPALSLHRRLAVASSSRGSHSHFLVLTLQSSILKKREWTALDPVRRKFLVRRGQTGFLNLFILPPTDDSIIASSCMLTI
ncbi:hypothetical protein LXL04_003133 [Taraxacum kok-saghyz]